MTKYRIAIQAFTGSKPTEFANVMVRTRLSLKTVQKKIEELFNGTNKS